jgi:hypothetical protein
MNGTDWHIMASLAAAAIVCALAAPAHAQTRFRPYVGGSIGLFSVDADEVDGRSVAPALVGGIAVSRFVDVEVEATFPTSTFRRSHTGPSTSFAPLGSSREEIERLAVITHVEWSREVAVNIAAVAIIHPAAPGRVVPALVAGVSNQWARNTTQRTPVTIPPGVDPRHPRVQPETERSTRNIGGPTFGGQLSIRVTPHFYVVPDIRYDYGSIGDEINNALRTSVRGIWRF